MPINPYQPMRNKLYQADELQPFQQIAPEAPGWVDMGGDQPVVDAGPAASAFKDRFLSPRPMEKMDTQPMPHGGGMALPGHEASLPNAAAGKGFKSL